MFESPEMAAADRIIAIPGSGAVVPVTPAERVIGGLEITYSGMRLLGPIRGILVGLPKVTSEANGAESGHAGGPA